MITQSTGNITHKIVSLPLNMFAMLRIDLSYYYTPMMFPLAEEEGVLKVVASGEEVPVFQLLEGMNSFSFSLLLLFLVF